MGRLTAPLLALALGAAAAVGLVACGGGSSAKLLPGNTASQITANLDEVKRLAQSGECAGAEEAAQQVSNQIDALGGVDKKLKQALREGAARLNEVVAGCAEETSEATVPPETLTESTTEGHSGKPKEKKPKKPEKTTPTTTPTETTTAPALPPQANGNGNGLGNGNGKGPGAEGGGTGAPPGGIGPGESVSGGD